MTLYNSPIKDYKRSLVLPNFSRLLVCVSVLEEWLLEITVHFRTKVSNFASDFFRANSEKQQFKKKREKCQILHELCLGLVIRFYKGSPLQR